MVEVRAPRVQKRLFRSGMWRGRARAFMGAEGCSMGTQLAVTASNHCGSLASAAGVPRIEPRWRAQPRLVVLQVAPPNTSNVHNY